VPSRSELPDFIRVLEELHRNEVDFVLIGGVAIQVHGGDHFTLDLDIVIRRTRENARRLVNSLASLHPRPVGWSDDLPFVWDEQTVMNWAAITLDTTAGGVDILSEPAGAPTYDELVRRAEVYDLVGDVNVASLDDLISMKRAAGRPKDIAHIAELETLKKLRAEDSQLPAKDSNLD
jgi:hypothetical protein